MKCHNAMDSEMLMVCHRLLRTVSNHLGTRRN